MIIARNLMKLWSWESDQIDPYIVLELFRGVPRPGTDFLEKCFSGENMCFSKFYRFYRLYRLCRLLYWCHTKDRQHAHHTQRENDTTNGGLPPSVLSARLFVCGVNVGALLCGTCMCFPSSVSARLCGARVLDDVRRGPGSAKPTKPSLALQVQK